MPTMIYRTADGKRVPSVTTVNQIGKDSGGLIHWAWQLGIDGIDYRAARDAAAESGTIGHALVEAAIKGVDVDITGHDAETQSKAALAFGAYQEWRRQTNLQIIGSEIALVSERWRYGGCMDAVAKQDDKYVLADWKTGALYPDHLCQVAAYGALWNEHQPDKQIQGYHLCRFNKDTGDFTHAWFGELSEGWDAFKLKRELYDVLAKLKKRV